MLSKILLNQSSLSFKIQLACSKAKQINSINRLDYMVNVILLSNLDILDPMKKILNKCSNFAM